jgi:tRNA threonylcarbamoyladenosine biosynthesis protein TsaE
MRHFETHLHDEAGTLALGAALAQTLLPGVVIYLHGDLGTGKTTLTRALLHAAGYVGPVKSPTYTLAEIYSLNLTGKACQLIHFDLYRMSSPEEFLEAGFRDYFSNGNICIVEWPEKGDSILPAPDIDLFLDVMGAGRRVKLLAMSEQGSVCLSHLQFAVKL